MVSDAQIKSILHECARILGVKPHDVPARVEQLLVKQSEINEQYVKKQKLAFVREKLAAVRKELKCLRNMYPDHPIWNCEAKSKR